MRWPFVSRERYDDLRAVLDGERSAHRIEVGELKQAALNERARHSTEMEKLHLLYERVIETQASAQKAAVEHAMNLVNFGMPKRVEAVVEEREPDAATRAARQVTEETIERATEALRTEYQKFGIPVADEELRAEAITLVTGGRWKPPVALAPFLKD